MPFVKKLKHFFWSKQKQFFKTKYLVSPVKRRLSDLFSKNILKPVIPATMIDHDCKLVWNYKFFCSSITAFMIRSVIILTFIFLLRLATLGFKFKLGFHVSRLTLTLINSHLSKGMIPKNIFFSVLIYKCTWN